MNISINIRLSEPTLNPYSNHDSKPLELSSDRLSEAIGGKGGPSPITFGGPDSTSRNGQHPLRLSPEDNAQKTAGSPQGGEYDIMKILEKLVQMIQEMMQNAMQKSGNNEEGKGETAPIGKASGGSPAQAQAPAGAGGGESVPAAGGPAGGAPVIQNAAVSNDASASQTVQSTGASGLHLPPALADHEKAIGKAADASGMPANVLAGMIWAESRGDSSASTVNGGNGKSDSGLMQVNSATAAEVQSKHSQHFNDNMTADEKNIMTGALYLKDQSEAFGGNMDAALRAYNSGANTVNLDDPSDISKTGLGDPAYVANVNNFAEIIGSGKGQLPA